MISYFTERMRPPSKSDSSHCHLPFREPVMAPIPLSLTLSNSSTLLTWLCVYVPHHLIVLFLLAGVIFVATLAGAGVFMLGWLTRKLFGFLRVWSAKRSLHSVSPKSPRAAPRFRTDLRHHSCPTHLLPIRCPHCFAEIGAPSPSPIDEHTKTPDHLASPRYAPPRRHSDLPPLAGTPLPSHASHSRQSLVSPLLLEESTHLARNPFAVRPDLTNHESSKTNLTRLFPLHKPRSSFLFGCPLAYFVCPK